MKRILVHTIPNSRKNEIITIADNILRIKVNASPIDGKANAEILKLLSKHFKIHKSQINITKGLANDKKIIEIID